MFAFLSSCVVSSGEEQGARLVSDHDESKLMTHRVYMLVLTFF